jgi:hypothetical protein
MTGAGSQNDHRVLPRFSQTAPLLRESGLRRRLSLICSMVFGYILELILRRRPCG